MNLTCTFVRIQNYTGFEISASVICEYLKEMNFSRQCMRVIAKQRDEKLRKDFLVDISLYKPHMLVFIDETGTDRRDSIRKYGYSIRGKTPQSRRCSLGENASL